MRRRIRNGVLWLLCIAMLTGGLCLPTAAETERNPSALHWESAVDMRTLNADAAPAADGTVELIDGTAEAWIDRVALPSCMRALYDTLAEGADNDGEADVLIEDAYLNDAEYVIPVVSETLTLAGGESNEALTELAEEVMDRYEPFLYAVFAAFDRDHPEVFWLDGQWRWAWEISSRTSRSCEVSICVGINQARAAEYPTETIIKTAIARRDEAIDEITGDFTWQTSDYEKVVHFNDVLTKTNQYNTSYHLNNIAFDCRECISALDGRVGVDGPVCEGYARAFKVLCDREGIPCVLVDGEADNGSGVPEGHMWNYVKVQGEWYAVDVTWNDPMTSGPSAALSGSESQKWLLVGGRTQVDGQSFLRSHPVSNQVYANFIGFTNGPTLSDTPFDAEAILTLNLPVGGYVYDGTEKKPQVSVKYRDTLLIENVDYTVSYSERCFTAGEHTVTVCLIGDYGGQVEGSYSIAKRTIVPTASVADKIYDGTATAELTLSIPDGSLCAGDSEVFLDGSAQFTDVNAGERVEARLTLRLTGADSDNYLAVAPDSVTASIYPRPVTVRADAKRLASGESEVKLTYTVDERTPLAEGDTLTGSLSLGERDADGVYVILQGTLTDENNPNYRITFVSATVSTEISSDSSVSGTGGAEHTGDVSVLFGLAWERLALWIGIAVALLVGMVASVAIVVAVRRKRKGE